MGEDRREGGGEGGGEGYESDKIKEYKEKRKSSRGDSRLQRDGRYVGGVLGWVGLPVLYTISV